MNEATMPVLIGCGQMTDKRPPEEGSTVIELMAQVARRAATDAGPGQTLLEAIDTIAALGLTVDSPESGSGANDMHTPSVTYPMFENALRAHYGLSLDQHRKKMGDLYQQYNAVAAKNPLSWFPTKRSSEDISTVSESNRYVGFPYTKFLNSVIQVNMGAAVILTSVAKARELGVKEDRMVYLHGCADANDIWNVSERVNYHSSPAVRTMGEKAFTMAGKTIEEMDFFDIYSCFPSAVQIACDELGLAQDDATIEAYTVVHGRKGVERALIIGLLDDGTRFIAETPDDEHTLESMMNREMIGTFGTVTSGAEKNLFVPHA